MTLAYEPDVLGIDVSFYQCDKKKGGGLIYPDFFKPAEKGVKWIKIRLAVGDYYVDPAFKGLYEGYMNTGQYEVTPYVVYAPARYDGGPLADSTAQVEYALRAWEKMGIGNYTGVQFTGDYELTRGRPMREVSGGVVRYHGMLEYMTNRNAMVYTRASWWFQNVTNAASKEIATPRNLHAAQYKSGLKPTGTPALPWGWQDIELLCYDWQYSADKPPNNMGPTMGVHSPNVDMNVRRLAKRTEPDPEPGPSPKKRYRVIADSMFIRSGPGQQHSVTGGLKRGDVVGVFDEIVATKWVRHEKGWSAASYDGLMYMEEV